MSGVRVLVGTRKGAFVLTSDGRRRNWAVSAPQFEAPLLLLHSRNDPLAPFEQSVEMEQRYRRESAFARLIPIDAPITASGEARATFRRQEGGS